MFCSGTLSDPRRNFKRCYVMYFDCNNIDSFILYYFDYLIVFS
ncbi:unnamed protein product [Brugia timori]|uniref:Uncharacterized protein n=1 Tax=Brugia timori TaxID=42155 RepID=A0A0R3Q7V3_9BILA|nr:unnamed protein product [Brugia timori]